MEKKNKIDFIADLLADKRMDVPLKEKTFELASKEIKSVSNIENGNLERILKIENRLEELRNGVVNKTKNTKIKFYHNLQETIKLLKLFDSDLKYLTHRWDSNSIFIREALLEKAKKELNKYAEWGENEKGGSKITGYKVPEPLWRRIYNFIDKNNNLNKKEEDAEWFVHHLFGETFNAYYSWGSDKFIEWFQNSTTKDISAEEINKNMIAPFKNSIQIRDGNLQKHIEPLVNKELGNEFNVEYKNLAQAKFYTDIQGLMGGIISILKESIMTWAKENDRFNVKFEFVETLKERYLKIVHLKSKCTLNSSNPDFLGGSLKGIAEKNLNKICNWSIEASFKDGNKRINILSDDKNLDEIEEIDYEPEGFTHILYFY